MSPLPGPIVHYNLSQGLTCPATQSRYPAAIHFGYHESGVVGYHDRIRGFAGSYRRRIPGFIGDFLVKPAAFPTSIDGSVGRRKLPLHRTQSEPEFLCDAANFGDNRIFPHPMLFPHQFFWRANNRHPITKWLALPFPLFARSEHLPSACNSK